MSYLIYLHCDAYFPYLSVYSFMCNVYLHWTCLCNTRKLKKKKIFFWCLHSQIMTYKRLKYIAQTYDRPIVSKKIWILWCKTLKRASFVWISLIRRFYRPRQRMRHSFDLEYVHQKLQLQANYMQKQGLQQVQSSLIVPTEYIGTEIK